MNEPLYISKIMEKLFYTTFLCLCSILSFGQKTNWVHLSTQDGKIPKPWNTTQQTAALVVDLDNDGTKDIVMGSRVQAPALVWYRHTPKGFVKTVIEKDFLTIEAGGTFADIDADGDQDIVFGGDWQSNKVWWWENPAPNFGSGASWKRHEIKNTGKNQHHDQSFGDFKQMGRPQLAYWNQGTKSLFVADIPANPTTDAWKSELIFSGEAGEKNSWYAEGTASADVDCDGVQDLIAGNYWFKYRDGKFNSIRFGEEGGRVAAGKFKPGKKMQMIVSPGDGKGRLMLYECNGSAEEAANWKGKDLIGRELIHGHTLEVADINQDGHLDIFCAEMAKWSEKETKPDNPNAEAFILYGDGKGSFTKTIFKKGWGFHEAKVADFDGDGDIDIWSKPYNWQTPRLDVWLQNGTGKAKPKIGSLLSGRFGLELYSLRDDLKKDVPATLAYVKSLGITEVEIPGFYGLTPQQFKAELTKAGLKPYSALMGYEMFRDSLSKIIETCKILGIKYVGNAWIPHKPNQFGFADAQKAVEMFNKAGQELQKNGIQFFYHTHGFEFRPHEDGTLFDYMVANTNPQYVQYQLDVYWAFHGGADPAGLLRRYKGRFFSLHVKDMKIGQETGEYSGGTPLTSDVAVGTGQLNFQEILHAAYATGVKYYYLEDENADVRQHLPISLAYLRALK
jgi:sugar phosphate isomerase/epimerase